MMRMTLIVTIMVLTLSLIAGCGGGGGEGGIVSIPTNTPYVIIATPTGGTPTSIPNNNTPVPTNTPGGNPTATPTSNTTATPTNTPTSTTSTVTPTATGSASVKMIIYKTDGAGGMNPQSGGTVTILKTDGTVVGTGSTGSDGSYTITGITPGSYKLQFELSGYEKVQYTRDIHSGSNTWTNTFGPPPITF